MGGTLPVLSKFAGREFAKLGRNIGALYALNTFGAVIGSFSTGFILLEVLGVSSSVYLAAATSMLVGVVAMSAGRAGGAGAGQPIAGEEAAGREARAGRGADAQAAGQDAGREAWPGQVHLPRYVSFAVLLAIAISGGAALAYEVIYAKVLVFSMGATTHAFTLMLTTFLVGIALGSFVSSRLADRFRRPTDVFGIVEVLIGLAALGSIYFLSRLDLAHEYLDLRDAGGDLLRLRWAGFLQAALIMLVPSFFMGAAFPVVARIYTRKSKVSQSVGRIYFFNTLGAVAGSLMAGFVLVPTLGSARSIALLAAFNIGAGIFLFSCRANRRFWAGISVAALIGFSAFAFVIKPSVFARTFNIKESGSELLYFKEGVSGTVTIHRYPGYDLIAIDGVNVAGTSDMLRVTQKLQGHLPILLADGKERVAHIGFGSGETLHILTMHHAGTIDGIEICKDVIKASRRFFASINKLAFDRPDVNVIIMDGKNYVLLTDKEYDIIMTDSIYPGAGGASALYSYDHFKAVRDKLKPGGVATCWLPLDLSPYDIRVALKAFYDVFPDMSVWYCYMSFSQHALIAGRKDAPLEIDLAKFTQAFEDSAIREDLADIFIDSPFDLASCLLADGEAVKKFCGDVPRHSDDHPILEFGSARRGTAKSYLSQNLEALLALRPNPLRYMTGIEEAGLDSALVAQQTMKTLLASSNIIGGHIHRALGEDGRARAQYQKALEIDPENLAARRSIEGLDATVTALELANKRGEGGYQTSYGLGVQYLTEGRFEEALANLERALALRPDLPDPHVTMGELYLRWGKPSEALQYFLDAREILPDNAGILFLLGNTYSALKRNGEARETYEKAVKLDPDDYGIRNALGSAYLSEGRIAEARREYEKAIELFPTRPYAICNLGYAYAAERNWERAIEYYKQCLQVSPAFFLAYVHMGDALQQLGHEQEAIRAWEAALSINPQHAGVKERLQAAR
jgi:spermidine synthase